MYIRFAEEVVFIGFMRERWYSDGLCMGEIFDGNGTNRDDVPFPYLANGVTNPAYAELFRMCDD